MDLTAIILKLCLLVTGAKVSFSQRGICILEKEGTSLMLDSVKSSLHLNQDTRELVDYSEKVWKIVVYFESFESQRIFTIHIHNFFNKFCGLKMNVF